MTAEQLAEAVKREIIELTDGMLYTEYMYVLTDKPNARGMTLGSHGWSGDADAELVAEEAHEYLDDAVKIALEKHPEMAGRWDYVNGCVLAFYGEG